MPNNVEERISLTPGPEHVGERLDIVLAGLLPRFSRAFLKKLMDRDAITIDSQPAKASYKLRGTETVHIIVPPADPLEAMPQDLPLAILYEDDDLIVINKRPGMVAHPSQGHRDGTLVNALLHHYGDSLSGIGGVLRPGIVHRLDKDTSGCLCAAKNDETHKRLIQQFMEREVDKIYLAITLRPPRPVSGTVEGNMGRSQRERKLHALLTRGGRHSLTHYETLENYGALALVRCRLMTGRTHQARVHLASVHAPILCDADYGSGGIYTESDAESGVHIFRHGTPAPGSRGQHGRVLLDRQALHAAELAFTHPRSGERMRFQALLPADMEAALAPFRAARAAMDA